MSTTTTTTTTVNEMADNTDIVVKDTDIKMDVVDKDTDKDHSDKQSDEEDKADMNDKKDSNTTSRTTSSTEVERNTVEHKPTEKQSGSSLSAVGDGCSSSSDLCFSDDEKVDFDALLLERVNKNELSTAMMMQMQYNHSKFVTKIGFKTTKDYAEWRQIRNRNRNRPDRRPSCSRDMASMKTAKKRITKRKTKKPIQVALEKFVNLVGSKSGDGLKKEKKQD